MALGTTCNCDERNDHDHAAEERVEHAVEAELFRGDRELAVDRQEQERIEFPGAHQLGDVGDVHEEERLEKLRDDLMRADEQRRLPISTSRRSDPRARR